MKKKIFVFLGCVLVIGIGLYLDLAGDETSSPYSSVKVIPFHDTSSNVNGNQIKKLFKEHKIETVVEIGSFCGSSTIEIAKRLSKSGKIFSVDSWKGFLVEKGAQIPLYQQFLSNVIQKGFTNNVVPVRMDNLEAVRALDIKPDLIYYLDASKDVQDALKDLQAWYPLLEEHGVLCGGHWGWPSMRAAVEKFAEENHLQIEVDGDFWRCQ